MTATVDGGVATVAPPPAQPTRAVRLDRCLWQVAGPGITHPWDAAAYLVLTPEPYLVDCGGPWSAEAVRRTVAATGTDPRAVRAVLATHRHVDHVGAAASWAAAGVPVLVGEGDCDAVLTGDPVATTAATLYGVDVPPATCQAMSIGRIVPGIDAVATPGHTAGSCSFVVTVSGRRVLLAGDTLWGGYAPGSDVDLDAWRRSLELLETLDIAAFSFGHGIRHLVDDDVPRRLLEARLRFGRYVDPWHAAPNLDVRY